MHDDYQEPRCGHHRQIHGTSYRAMINDLESEKATFDRH
jgi:hypothetical protein